MYKTRASMMRVALVCSLPQRVSLVESKAGVNNHSNPEGNEQNKKSNVPAFPVVPYDSSHLCTSIT